MSSFSLATPAEAPDWLLHYQATNRTPDYRTKDRWVFRTTAQDREQFEALAGADGVELLMEADLAHAWEVLSDEEFAQAAGEVFEAAHEGTEGEDVFVMDMESSSMRLVKYPDGVLSSFDTGMEWLDDRARVYASVEEAFGDADEMWFEPAEPLTSISSAVHSSQEIADRLNWSEDVDEHELTINGEAWKYEPDEGVTRVTKKARSKGKR